VTRGADGLTADELRRGRQGWWNPDFTRALGAAIPADAERLVEIGCGLGKVAAEILPARPTLAYVGVDVDRARLADARAQLGGVGASDRVRLLAARGEELPVRAGAVDCVLTAMALMHVPEPAVVIAEALRVLRSGGVLVAAEPDNLSQRFYFDGLQQEVTRAFAALATRSRELRRPADIAIGPRVAGMVVDAGFVDVEMRIHATYASRHQTAAACAETWRWILSTMAGAAGQGAEDRDVRACESAIATWLARAEPDRECFCGSTVPMFFTTGRKP